ncbi:MAG: glycosyltransferase family A protein [Pseudomonadota bacterium]
MARVPNETQKMQQRAQSRPTLSIGLPVYNGERLLAASLDSLLAQDFEDFEIVICDNASTDSTRLICENYLALDKRVRYVRNAENIGVFANYDRVLRLAKAPLFKWAACGDLCASDFLTACTTVLFDRPEVVLVSPQTLFFADRPEHAELHLEPFCDQQSDDPLLRFENILHNLSLNNIMNGVIRREALLRTGLNRAFSGSDQKMMAELALHGKFVQIQRPLFYRRLKITPTRV